MTQAERDSYFFAETVRKMANGLLSDMIAGDYPSAQETALSLVQQAVSHKRALEATQQAEAADTDFDPDSWDGTPRG